MFLPHATTTTKATTSSRNEVEIALVDLVSISAKPFLVSKSDAAEHDEPAESDTLQRFVFKDETLEAQSIHVRLCIQGGKPDVEFLTFVRDSCLVEELAAARDVAFVRRALLLVDPSTSERHNRGGAQSSLMEEVQKKVTFIPVENFSQSNFRSKMSQTRQRSAENALVDDHVVALLRRLEDIVLTDLQLKREFFRCPQVMTTLLKWLDNLDEDLLNTFRNNSQSDLVLKKEEDENDISTRARTVQLALVLRATAGLRVICAALFDSRDIDERFQFLCLPDWPISKMVDTLATDSFNYTEESAVHAREAENFNVDAPVERRRELSNITAAQNNNERHDDDGKTVGSSGGKGTNAIATKNGAKANTTSALFQAAAAQENLRKQRSGSMLKAGGETQEKPSSNNAAAGKAATKVSQSQARHDSAWGQKQRSRFMYDPWSTVPFADAQVEPDDSRYFADLLDAQVATLWQLDQLTAAWCREKNRVKTPHGDEITRDIVPKLISRDTGQASQLLEAIFERSIAITLKLSEFDSSTQRTERPLRHILDGSRITLLSHARFLAAMVRCSYENRQIAATNHMEDMENFLQQEEFYQILAKDQLTFIAGQSLMEATGLAMNARNTSEEERQLSPQI